MTCSAGEMEEVMEMTNEIEWFYAKRDPDDYVLECVTHKDHLAAMKAKDAEIARLTALLEHGLKECARETVRAAYREASK